MIGYLAVICGVLAIFTWGIVFVPMSMAFAIAAMIAGQGAWGFSGARDDRADDFADPAGIVGSRRRRGVFRDRLTLSAYAKYRFNTSA